MYVEVFLSCEPETFAQNASIPENSTQVGRGLLRAERVRFALRASNEVLNSQHIFPYL